MVKSISFDEQEIIRNIINLHCEVGIELDPTYSKGNFYRTWEEKDKPRYKFDLYPQVPGVVKADAECLPIGDSSIKTMMFDPPFLATKGKSLSAKDSSNKITKRFGCYPSEQELHQFYINSLREFHRILKEGGVLIFKCQDKISSGKQFLSHVFIINEAEKLGFYCKDLFILLAKNRIMAKWQLKNQKNSRKFHSYFLVLQKTNKKIKYI